jgi:hyperosmotically inducible protein
MTLSRPAFLLIVAGLGGSSAMAAPLPGTALTGLPAAPDSPAVIEPALPASDTATADAVAATQPGAAVIRESQPGGRLFHVLPAALPILAEGNTLPSHGTGAATDDSAIIEEINSRLVGDPRLANTVIRVQSVNGTVVLSGNVPTDEARQAAEEVAQQVEGVTRVDNQLSSPSSARTIKERSEETLQRTERVASDSWITTKIRSTLLADPITRGMNIGVKTMDGVVSLSGRVETQAEYDRTMQLASGIKGVKRVNASELRMGKAE